MLRDNDDAIDWERLDRYIRGVGNPDERAALEAWVAADPKRRAFADAMRTVGHRRAGSMRPPDARRALGRMRRDLGLTPPPVPKPRVEWARPRRSLLLESGLVFVGVVTLLTVARFADSRRTAQPARASGPPPREIMTQPGQRARAELGDASFVILSADSRLTIADVSRSRREVTLSGEALFSIRHDSTRTFVVRTAYGTIEDLGTEFVVNTYPETQGMRLAVREGRVTIHADAGGLTPRADARADSAVAILGAGDVVHVGATGDLNVSRRQDVSSVFASSDGALILQGVALRDAIPMLERWFGIRIQVADPGLRLRRVSGTFRNQSAQAAMDVIALALDQRARWTGTMVTLVKGVDGGNPP
jgi:transmembrane sensor